MSNKPVAVVDEQAISLIEGLKAGTINPGVLNRDQKILCTEYLKLQGISHPEIAKLLGISDRTVTRYVADIRDKNAMHPSPELTAQIVGEFMTDAQSIYGQQLKLSRDKEASVMEKSIALSSAWKIKWDVVKMLQSLGYLPTVPVGAVVDVVHHQGDDFQDMANVTMHEIKVLKNSNLLSQEDRSKLDVLQHNLDKTVGLKQIDEQVSSVQTQAEEVEYETCEG